MNHQERVLFAQHAKSAILVHLDQNRILFSKNPHKCLPPASMTKIMTLLLIMDAIHERKIKLSDRVSVSKYASSMRGSTVFLRPGEIMTVNELLTGITLASGNDAAVAMAEHLAGSQWKFVEMMNFKAEKLGLRNTHFESAHGFTAKNHYSSAYDLFVMSKELIKHKNIIRYTEKKYGFIRNRSKSPLRLVNTNSLVKACSGVDGLKTGYTHKAKYCLSATAKRGGNRVIAIVMGEPTKKARNDEVIQMLNYAFQVVS